MFPFWSSELSLTRDKIHGMATAVLGADNRSQFEGYLNVLLRVMNEGKQMLKLLQVGTSTLIGGKTLRALLELYNRL